MQGPGHGRLFPGEPQTQGPRILLRSGPAELLARLGLLGTQMGGWGRGGGGAGAEAAARALAVLGETLPALSRALPSLPDPLRQMCRAPARAGSVNLRRQRGHSPFLTGALVHGGI